MNTVPLPAPKPKLLLVDGEVRVVEPKNGSTFSLQELQDLVGGYIEVVYPQSKTGAILVVNENGLTLDLPTNETASLAAGRPIVGNAVVCHTSQVP